MFSDLSSWLIIYINFFLGIGLGALTLIFIIWFLSKIFKFIYSEYNQYKPNRFLSLFSEIIKSSALTDSIIKWLFSPQPKVQPQHQSETLSEILDRMNQIEKMYYNINLNPTRDNHIIKDTDVACVNETLNSIIKGSVDISDLDMENKTKLINSFLMVIQSLDYINGQITINSNELNAILDRIEHNINSMLEVAVSKNSEKDHIIIAKNMNIPIEGIYDMLNCIKNKSQVFKCHPISVHVG